MKEFLLNNIETYISLMSKIKDGIVIYKEDMSIVYANPSACDILGLSEDQLLGKTAMNHEWHFVNEEKEAISLDEYPVNLLFNSEKDISKMLIGIHSSKIDLKWVEASASIAKNEKNERIAFIIFNDVTARKNTFDEAELFKKLVDIVDTGITISDPFLEDNPLLYVNKSFSKITGYSLDEAVSKNCRYLQKKDIEQPEIAIVKEAILNQKTCEVILKNYKKDGTLFYNLLNITPLYQKNKLRYFVGVQHDITEQIEQEKKLSEQSLYIQSILDAQENMVLVSNGRQTSYSNQAVFDFFGLDSFESFKDIYNCISYTFEEDDSYFHLGKIESDEYWVDAVLSIAENQRIVSIKNQRDGINYFNLEIKAIASSIYVLTLNDITLRLLKERALATKAYHDALTGLYNRQYFYEYIVIKTLKKSSIIAIIIIDIDDFKSVNDIYGHSAGDKVLKVFASTLQDTLRPSDYLIRWGGEEFVVVSETKSNNEVLIIAEHLRIAVSQIELPPIKGITASFGVTNLKDTENIDTAIGRADRALYTAKECGKNRVEMI